MPLTPSERSLRGQIAAHESWFQTVDRNARTANARKAFEDKFLEQAGGDPKRAESLRRAYFGRLALKSAQARRRRTERDRTAVVQSRLTELDGGGGNAA